MEPSKDKGEKVPYIRETIVDKRKDGFLHKLLISAACAVVFGAVAAAVFFGVLRLLGGNKEQGKIPVNTTAASTARESTTHAEPTTEEETEKQETTREETGSTPAKESESTEENAILPEGNPAPSLVSLIDHLKAYTVPVMAVNQSTDWLKKTVEIRSHSKGIVIRKDKDGIYVITSASKINTAKDIYVSIFGKLYPARLRSIYYYMDIALISVKQITDSKVLSKIGTIPYAKEPLRIGETIYMFGSPLGYSGSVTSGILSYYESKVPILDGNSDILYTNIPRVERGGGLFVNGKGELIGWTLPKESKKTPYYQALGLEALKPVITDFTKDKEIAYFGIEGTEIPEEIRKEKSLEEGLYITKVYSGSPAYLKGLQEGDILTRLNHENIRTTDDLQRFLRSKSPGDTIYVTYVRGSRDNATQHQFSVRLSKA